ncbi:hypothetical protein NQ318_012292 [Aromia moschata]|uniref:DUF4817 domain-containing protein n=1 Tax=Aromia moschata TaxID=1265417 RepID=A0AAV8YKV5_9CUCU|nr:hypothetical protein NQ318_012292 [Aromia moschata]
MIGYGDRARTQCEVVRLFRETHPDLPPLNQGTISKIGAQYREMGHVRKVPSKRQAVVDDDTKLNLFLALKENPITPARQLTPSELVNDGLIISCGFIIHTPASTNEFQLPIVDEPSDKGLNGVVLFYPPFPEKCSFYIDKPVGN